MVGCLPVLGQTPRASSVTKAPGETVTLDISVNSQPSTAPVALKWEVVFPARLMEMESDGAQISSAARDAGKSLQCTVLRSYSYVCTLSGGQRPIPNGPVASLHFKILATAEAGRTTLRVERAEATTVDSRIENVNNTESVVIIQ